jgi:hypothetical protein
MRKGCAHFRLTYELNNFFMRNLHLLAVNRKDNEEKCKMVESTTEK